MYAPRPRMNIIAVEQWSRRPFLDQAEAVFFYIDFGLIRLMPTYLGSN